MTASRLIKTKAELRVETRRLRRNGVRVGFVPTMGALHSGHLKLIEVAREQTDAVVVSIFVNPTQFGEGEDLDRYPRQLERDRAKCEEEGVDIVYAPSVDEMYPPGSSTTVNVDGLTKGLCGPFRPGHFQGVATVVAKLFNQVGPCIAVFGRKDYQQLKVIERLAADLDLDVQIIGVATVREPDGLALSSRNAYLKEAERERARSLVKGLSAAWRLVESSEVAPTAASVRKVAASYLEDGLDRVDYVEVCDPETLVPLEANEKVLSPTLIAMAGWLGSTRLIDNLVVREQPDPLC